MSQYVAAVPKDGQVPADIQSFFERFYQASDSSTEFEKYASFFTPDGRMEASAHSVQGQEEIVGLRRVMWEKVAKRSHHPLQIFTFGAGSDEYMLHGKLDFVYKDGSTKTAVWAARAQLAKGQDGWKLKYYEVYI